MSSRARPRCSSTSGPEWCGPCHAVAPVLEQIAEGREGELKVVKLNIDDEQELAMRYGVMSIPTMILFRDGEPAAAVTGAHPKGRHRARSRPRTGRGGLTGQLERREAGPVGLLAVRLRAEVHFEPARLLK